MKTCIGCNESLDLKKFYVSKFTGKHASRCMPCARKQVSRRYHAVTRPKLIESRRMEKPMLYGEVK